ncbi:hypothetical protein M2284_003976 [Rhodococcus sp. LBL1]|nr:hypothetical protein [Rhodococcus sp. LBL1]MDH6682128.1 hypothetical protein [Rhodococcus sp. LBL2]
MNIDQALLAQIRGIVGIAAGLLGGVGAVLGLMSMS